MADAKKIVVIEDDDAIHLVLCSGLKKKGFEVWGAKDGMEGLNLVRTKLPDLLISDIMLPKMDGYKIASFLKADVKTKAIPIVFMTAKGQQADKEMGAKVGATRYLVKPFKIADLIGVVEEVLGMAPGSAAGAPGPAVAPPSPPPVPPA